MNRIERKAKHIVGQLNILKNVIISQDIGLDRQKLDPILKQFEIELKKQLQEIIREANKPVPPRDPKAILNEILRLKDVTPEILAEIERLKKEIKSSSKKKSKKKSGKKSKG